nr:RICIN domain-containing protein [Yinghuangia sp. ASG 101]
MGGSGVLSGQSPSPPAGAEAARAAATPTRRGRRPVARGERERRVRVRGPATTADRNARPSAGRCVDAEHGGTANGTYVQLVRCDGSPARRFTPVNNTLYTKSVGRCVDLGGSATQDGAAIRLYDCTGRPNRLWTR